MPEQLIGDVSDTAFWIAHYRAIESERPDALFHDALAETLAGERGKKIAQAMPMTFWTGWSVVLRTCIIDDYIRWAIGEGVDTVLNLGAGLDTRPYRMELPESLVWIEADYPHMIEFKEERLAKEKPRCRLERVKIDLANVAERRHMLAAVDARARKMLVLTEGVVPYLSEEQAASLAEDLRTMANARYWVLDYFSPEVVKYRGRNGMHRHMRNAPFKFAPEDWWGFFEKHGWRQKEIRYYFEEAQRRKRMLEPPLRMRVMFMVRGIFLSKQRREALQKLAGYVLLEPKGSSESQEERR
ncbi:MAG: class I SAM-dependent methyltransferase [Bryobacteraceae bacterium]